jgi:hypothetical protein
MLNPNQKVAADKAGDEYMTAIGGIHRNMPPMLRINIEMRMWLDFKIALYTIVGKTELISICEQAKLKYV